MEYNEHGNFLEELLALTQNPTAMSDIYNSVWSYGGCSDENPFAAPQNSSFEGLSLPLDQIQNCAFSELNIPFTDDFSAPAPFPAQEEYSMAMPVGEDELGQNGVHGLELMQGACKFEPIQSNDAPGFDAGFCPERKNKTKKADGQPSKNLMAERRRRKRLNDRLSMLRSVVPKISKMDRTSILGDTIDYMKELMERINNLQEETEVGPKQMNLMSIFKDVKKPNEVIVKNSPKFDVERRNVDTRIEICCGGKQGLLLSTMSTLEALGLEIQQCVISCFNDFSMQASCSEDMEHRAMLSSEDIKQALFRNAGYGGRCL